MAAVDNQAGLPPAIFLMGPTASGKTAATVELYQSLPIEIISVDSALVYQDMNIGTAKPEATLLAKAPHYLLDLIPPTQQYSAAQFSDDALKLMAEISARGKVPLLVGGTMLYFNALQHGLNALPTADIAIRQRIEQEARLHGWPAMHQTLAQIDPEVASQIQTEDSQRIERALEVFYITGQTMTALRQQSKAQALPYRLLKIGLVPSDRKVLHQRIAERFSVMLKQGLVEEVQGLLKKYPTLNSHTPSMRCVGYRQTLAYLNGEITLEALAEQGVFATRQLAKRQLTWLRGMDDLLAIDCLSVDAVANVVSQSQSFLSAC